MYVQEVSLYNLRCIEQTKIRLRVPPEDPSWNAHPNAGCPNVTLLLGDNGSGKTTVLRAIALASLPRLMLGFVPYRLVRRTAREEHRAEIRARLSLDEQDLPPTRKQQPKPWIAWSNATLKRGTGDNDLLIEGLFSSQPHPLPATTDEILEGLLDDKSPAFLVLGYGAMRRAESSEHVDLAARAKARGVRYARVASLFEDLYTLVPLSAWLPRWRAENPGRHKQVVQLINELLPEGTKLLETLVDDQHVFEHRGAQVPFPALSDGFRSYISWIGDLLYHVCMGCPKGVKLVENRGVVLVDEVDLLLHPSWQRTVIPRLARALPRLQFVLTTHSPTVVGTLPPENLRLLRQQENSGMEVVETSEKTLGRTSDQLLISELFGLSSTREPHFARALQDAAIKARDGGPEDVSYYMDLLNYGAAALRRTENSPRKSTAPKKPKARRTKS